MSVGPGSGPRVVLTVGLIFVLTHLAVLGLLHVLNLAPIEPADLGLRLLLPGMVAAVAVYWWVVRRQLRTHAAELGEARRLALHDQLTGLPNRRLLYEHLEKRLSRLSRNRRSAALLYVDLDGFKSINDEFGHSAGDAVLCALATRVVGVIRSEDVFARIGGDEFMLLLQDVGPDREAGRARAARVAVKIQRLLIEPVVFGEDSIPIACSIGINVIDAQHAGSVRRAIQEADVAMYAAKRNARGGIMFASQAEVHAYPFVSIGHAEIDRQHRWLDGLLNPGPGADRQRHLAEAAEAIREHFEDEARVAAQIGRPLSARHLAEHQRLLDRIGDLQAGSPDAWDAGLCEQMHAALRQHIIEYDLEITHPDPAPVRQRIVA